MISLNLPPAEIKTRQTGGITYVFDFLRRRYVKLTPEEWVRQHFTHFLVDHKGYPPQLLANEVGIRLNGSLRRCDSVLYDRNGGRPRVVMEYKAPTVALTQEVFNQICSYNSLLRADYLFVSNGLMHVCCRMLYAEASYAFLRDVPAFSELA